MEITQNTEKSEKPKSNKIKLILIISAALIIIAAVVIVIVIVANRNSDSDNKKSSKSSCLKTLNYQLNDEIYSIEEYKTNFNIIIKNQVICIKTPCNPLKIDEKTVNNEDDCRNLTTLFNEVFNSTNEKEKSVRDTDLSNKQLETILFVLENNNIISKLNYEIIKNKHMNNRDYKERGYYTLTNNHAITYTIAMGEKPSSGYSIDIKNIDIGLNSVEIIIDENNPPIDAIVFTMVTYPIVEVTFNRKPFNITITNDKKGENFQHRFIRNYD